MVNEHYVQQSYLRLFAPDDEGVLARYSLVKKHGGGDYFDPIEEYPISKAAASEGYAGGILESDETTRAENAMVQALRSLDNDSKLSEEDIAHLSQFVAFQRVRSPRAKVFHRLREDVSNTAGIETEDLWELAMHVDASERYDGFQYLGWRIVENQTDLPFFTSDVPVAIYQDEHPGNALEEGFQFEEKQIFCPISPDKLLLFLDPSTFDVEPQFPRTTIDHIPVTDKNEIWKFNLLQGISAFHEIFGPVGHGNKLEQVIEVLSRSFTDEDYIRGARWNIDRIIEAQKAGIRESSERPKQDTIPREDKDIITSYSKMSSAIWRFNHRISIIDELRRDEAIPDYWN